MSWHSKPHHHPPSIQVSHHRSFFLLLVALCPSSSSSSCITTQLFSRTAGQQVLTGVMQLTRNTRRPASTYRMLLGCLHAKRGADQLPLLAIIWKASAMPMTDQMFTASSCTK
jgi:hypothetical protein